MSFSIFLSRNIIFYYFIFRNKITLLFTLFLFYKCQIPKGYAINSCGKDGLGYKQPSNDADCKDSTVGKNYCCYVAIQESEESETVKFCTFVPGNINDDVKEDFQKTLEATKVEVVCYKKSNYIILNSFLLIALVLFLF